jgi:tellurite methyltransferase
MSIQDRERWDERHRHVHTLSARASVTALPAATTARSRALDLACGQGRHTLALRALGYSVVAMDVSRRALANLMQNVSGDRQVLAVAADADAWPFAPSSFDLVVQVDFLDRRLFPVLPAALRPGGLLLVDTFLDCGRRNAEGPSSADFLLKPGELASAFRDLEPLRYEERTGDTARAVLLARRT